ncbi:DUF4384 domain-containing protein [Paraliomyxa miuraensis]|uniref:DUF4384 domain-containing protein n=1 Tax=Paraliomyxa miuraensis TaxID=376150 RepID=UPI00224D9F64|nr:DUF4384 domain-containing protein [Paraliomyxa miuraensis]MCX4243553.1 DUF4384 domain-containing protein [Paraliomyxa miuraensis]
MTKLIKWLPVVAGGGLGVVLALGFGGCGKGPPKPPAADVTCPDGSVRPQVDCATDLGLKGRVVDANASLGQIGLGIGASYEEKAVGQVTDSTYQLALRLESACKDYNACVMSADAYATEASRIRDRLEGHVALVQQLQGGVGEEAGDAVWSNAVPQLAAERLSLQYRLEARSGGGPAFVHHDGGSLRSGDEFRVVVRSDREAYVYILLMSSQGVPSQLFPLAEMGLSNPLPAGVEVAIPNDGTFALDASPGEESLQILASTRPLTDIETRLRGLAGVGRQAVDPVVDQARQGLLGSVGQLLCEGAGKETRGIVYKKASAACDGRERRGIVYKKAADVAQKVAAQPGDDVIVVQHHIDHR